MSTSEVLQSSLSSSIDFLKNGSLFFVITPIKIALSLPEIGANNL